MSVKYQSNRYTRIEDLKKNDLIAQEQSVKNDKFYYPNYHIAPKYGLLNDPNGLIYHNGMYHIFYQYCPNGPFHGLKSWNLLTTSNFIDYVDHGIVLHSTEFEENYGVYSGSAIIIDGQINLIYTANHRDPKQGYKRFPYQMIAVLDDGYNIVSKRVIYNPNFDFHTEHFRDPVAVSSKQLMIGSQDTAGRGQIGFLTYPDSNYYGQPVVEYLKSNLNLTSYMIECPNWFQTEDHDILICSPQGLESDGDNYRNIHDVIYSISALGELLTMSWSNPKYAPVDSGFDFYAPQIFNDGKRTIMIGWLGLPDTEYPTDEQYGWSHMLTIPRQLRIKNNKLLQTPVEEIYNLFTTYQHHQSNFQLTGRGFHVKFSCQADFEWNLGNKQYYLKLMRKNNKVVLDRSNCQLQLSTDFGTERTVSISDEQFEVECFVDNSALEIYINNGQHVMTSRFYIENLDMMWFEAIEDLNIAYTNGINIKENYE